MTCNRGIRLPPVHSYFKQFIKMLAMSVDLPDGRKWVDWIICGWKKFESIMARKSSVSKWES